MNVREIEDRIIDKLLADILERRYTVSVYDGEDWAMEFSTDAAQIKGAMRATDYDWLYLFERGEFHTATGFVFLVYGNSGDDLITDYTANEATEACVAGASELANQIAEGR